MARIILSPSKYVQGAGEITKLAQYYKKLGTKGAFALVDPFILGHYEQEILSGFTAENTPIKTEAFQGECSKTEINRIVEKVSAAGSDAVIGIGGGKTLDTAKSVAHYTNLPVIIVPTIASTDAPCSALAVLYTDDGQFEEYLFLKANPNLVLVDTEIIAQAPARLLVAGMGDALATYFEARASVASNAVSIAGGSCSKAALTLAYLCFETLLEDGLKAKLAVENKVSSQALENIIEANTYLSGVGFESGGLAAAHAIHNGLTVLPECHHMFHGEKVAFGTIVQLVLENADLEEVAQIITFCKSLGLPTTLKELGVQEITQEKIMAVATASCAEGETIHNMPFRVTAQDVYGAIMVANQLGSRC